MLWPRVEWCPFCGSWLFEIQCWSHDVSRSQCFLLQQLCLSCWDSWHRPDGVHGDGAQAAGDICGEAELLGRGQWHEQGGLVVLVTLPAAHQWPGLAPESAQWGDPGKLFWIPLPLRVLWCRRCQWLWRGFSNLSENEYILVRIPRILFYQKVFRMCSEI